MQKRLVHPFFLFLLVPQSESPEGHGGLSKGLVPYTVPADAMKCIIVLGCGLDVAKSFFVLSSHWNKMT